jgi:hypothetical protein
MLVSKGLCSLKASLTRPAGLGNCGQQNVDTDPIVAISKQMYDQSNGGYCNQVGFSFAAGVQSHSILFQWVQITYNGKSVYAMVRDSCPGCAYNDLGEK